MEDLHEFSHVFELFAGIYFGALVLFEHLHKRCIEFFEKFNEHKTKIESYKFFLKDFRQMSLNTRKPKENENLNLKTILLICGYFLLHIISRIADFVKFIIPTLSINYLNNKVHKISSDEKYIHKKYLPIFAFAGCLCVALTIFTPLLSVFKTEDKFLLFANDFIKLHLYLSFLFYLVVIYFMNPKINKIKIIKIILIDLVIGFIFFSFALVITFLHLNGVYLPHILPHSDSLFFTILIIAITFPLLFLIREIFLVSFSIGVVKIFEKRFTHENLRTEAAHDIDKIL